MALIQFNFPKRKKKKAEFTKVVIGGVMVLYFAAAVFGGVIVWFMHDMLGEWLTFIGAPTTAALGFYCWKAKNENIIKLGGKPDFKEETEENKTEVQG